MGQSILNYRHKTQNDAVAPEEIDNYLNLLYRRKEDWQVQQAREAIQIHQLFLTQSIKNTREGYGIRTIQELLGHSSVRTTMIYTHVAGKNLMGVKNPLDM